MDLDGVKFNKYHSFIRLLYGKYNELRDEGFEVKEGSDVFKLIDIFCETLADKTNITPN
jgi:hypothetical protein